MTKWECYVTSFLFGQSMFMALNSNTKTSLILKFEETLLSDGSQKICNLWKSPNLWEWKKFSGYDLLISSFPPSPPRFAKLPKFSKQLTKFIWREIRFLFSVQNDNDVQTAGEEDSTSAMSGWLGGDGNFQHTKRKTFPSIQDQFSWAVTPFQFVPITKLSNQTLFEVGGATEGGAEWERWNQ